MLHAKVFGLNSCLLLAVVSSAAAEVELRVANSVYQVGRTDEQVASSITIMVDGAVYDRLETPAQTIIFDPVRERVVVLDRERKLKVELPLSALGDFSARFRKWASASTDPLLAVAASRDAEVSADEEARKLSLAIDGMTYDVEAAAAPDAAAEQFRAFADAAVMAQALLHPGGSPPFLRLRLNEELAARDWLPRSVTLQIASRRSPAGRVPEIVLRSEHDVDPGLADSDRRLVREAHAEMADFKAVAVEEFVGRKLPVSFNE